MKTYKKYKRMNPKDFSVIKGMLAYTVPVSKIRALTGRSQAVVKWVEGSNTYDDYERVSREYRAKWTKPKSTDSKNNGISREETTVSAKLDKVIDLLIALVEQGNKKKRIFS